MTVQKLKQIGLQAATTIVIRDAIKFVDVIDDITI